MSDLRRLKAKLYRELSQSERSARLHGRREAERLGAGIAARALLAIAEHAEASSPRFEALYDKRRSPGVHVGSLFGRVFSEIRHRVLDRLIDAERSYRGTLLGVHHGIGVVRLLAEVVNRDDDAHLYAACHEWLLERRVLIKHAERALSWFADRRSNAVRARLVSAVDIRPRDRAR